MYKTIVVHVDDSAHLPDRVHAAALLARDVDAHLIGSAATGISYANYAMLFGSMAMPATQAEFDAMRAKGRAALDRFVELAQRHGVAAPEARLLDQDNPTALLLQSRYADLLVTSQATGEGVSSAWDAAAGLPAYLALHSGRPVLALPPLYVPRTLDGPVVVGWDGGLQAMRAITLALPLLQRAKAVHLLVAGPQHTLEADDDEPGAEMALYLARHGVTVEVALERSGVAPGDAILRLAHERDCSLIVAGAYGHTRFREVVLGGATRALLTNATVPVLLAH